MANNSTKEQEIETSLRASRSCIHFCRFIIPALSACTLAGHAHAIGLGDIDVKSGIGQPMRATVALHGSDLHDVDEHCLKGSVAALDSGARSALRVGIRRSGNSILLALSGSRNVDEPAAVVTIESQCGTRVAREYTVLLDPVTETPRSALAAAAARQEPFKLAQSPHEEQATTIEHRDAAPRTKTAGIPAQRVRPVAREAMPRPQASVLRLSSVASITADIPPETGFLRLRLANVLADPPPPVIAHMPARTEAPQGVLAASYAVPAPLVDKTDTDDSAAAAEKEAPPELPVASAAPARGAIGSAFRTLSDQIAGALYFGVIMAGAIWLVLRLRAMSAASRAHWIPVAAAEPEVKVHAAQPKAQDEDVAPADNIRVWPGNAIHEPPELPAGDPNLRNTLPQAEEIMDVMEQVQFFLSIGDHGNAQRLLEHVIAEQGDRPGSPWPWLSLFDIYMKTGEQELYEDLHVRFNQRYNAHVPDWGMPWEETEGLEGLPHLRKRITQLWKSDKIVPFLERLLVDNRGGTRQGFDICSFQDIRMLLEVAYLTHDSKKYLKPALHTPSWSVAA